MEALVEVGLSPWRLLDHADAGTEPAIECGAMRVTLSPALHYALRALIAGFGRGTEMPYLHGFVAGDQLVEPGANAEPQAVVRGLRAAFCVLGLADMVLTHDRYGYRLRYPAGARH